MALEYLKFGDNVCGQWLVRMFNVCLNARQVPMDGEVVCIVPLYKGKDDSEDCGRKRAISF